MPKGGGGRPRSVRKGVRFVEVITYHLESREVEGSHLLHAEA